MAFYLWLRKKEVPGNLLTIFSIRQQSSRGKIFDFCGFKSFFKFFNTIIVSSHMYPENPEGTQVIVGSMNMGYSSEVVN